MAVLLAVIIILITGALAVGVFLNYKRTGSFIPSMPKLPRYLIVVFTLCFCLWMKTTEVDAGRIQIKVHRVLFLSSLSSLVKSGDTGNGVTFRSGDNVDLGPAHIGVSFIDTAMQMVSPGSTLRSSYFSLSHSKWTISIFYSKSKVLCGILTWLLKPLM